MKSKFADCLEKAKSNENESSISDAEKTLLNEEEARHVFSRVKAGLLTIQQWNENAVLSSYEVFDEKGNELADKGLHVGDFIRIWLKGSGKYDWVKITDVFDREDEFVITVKPTFDPTDENLDKNLTSHFLTDEATNNFCLSRDYKTVKFYIIGLDEKRNTQQTENALETVRNLAVNLSTYLGIQNGEWEKFAHHFLESAAEIERENTLKK